MYYNTTNEIGNDLKESRSKANTQDNDILEYFKKNEECSPSQVWKVLREKELDKDGVTTMPLTSVRRSITNLTKKGYLEKTTDKRKGIYGKPEYIWRLYVSKEEVKHLEELGEAWASEQPWK